jgi:hypothetical protein
MWHITFLDNMIFHRDTFESKPRCQLLQHPIQQQELNIHVSIFHLR